MLLFGSRVLALQALVSRIYRRQLACGRVMFPVWQWRSEKIIEECDARSRWVDSCSYAAPPALFWKANSIAKTLWGHGFTYDRAADSQNVQPTNSQRKLAFNSRWGDP